MHARLSRFPNWNKGSGIGILNLENDFFRLLSLLNCSSDSCMFPSVIMGLPNNIFGEVILYFHRIHWNRFIRYRDYVNLP